MILKETDHKSFEHSYLIGDCHNMAIALHRELGLPMVSFFKRTELPEEEWFGDEEEDKYLFEHAHAAILLDNNTIVDVRGIVKLDKTEEENLVFMADAIIPVERLKTNDEEFLASYYADYEEELIQEAIDFSKELGIKSMVLDFKKENKRKVKRKI